MIPDDWHVYPLDDTREHITEGTGCPCCPVIEVDGGRLIIVHSAWDGRDAVEQAIDIVGGSEAENETLEESLG